jgi:hypothetical protein
VVAVTEGGVTAVRTLSSCLHNRLLCFTIMHALWRNNRNNHWVGM